MDPLEKEFRVWMVYNRGAKLCGKPVINTIRLSKFRSKIKIVFTSSVMKERKKKKTFFSRKI